MNPFPLPPRPLHTIPRSIRNPRPPLKKTKTSITADPPPPTHPLQPPQPQMIAGVDDSCQSRSPSPEHHVSGGSLSVDEYTVKDLHDALQEMDLGDYIE
jgi:hypothetical protein